MVKAKYWEGILYPENMIAGWEELIGSKLEFPFAYCVHDKDLQKDSEETRKAHVHVLLAYPAPTTAKQVLKLFNRLSQPGTVCCPVVQDKYNIRSAYNYLIHDTDESRKAGKYQYEKSCRIEGNNFDIGMYEQLSLTEKDDMCDELCHFILKEQITNYADFYLAVAEKYDKSYIRIIKTYSGHLERLIRGVYQRKKQELENEKLENIKSYVSEMDRMDRIIKAQKDYINLLEQGK